MDLRNSWFFYCIAHWNKIIGNIDKNTNLMNKRIVIVMVHDTADE